MNERAKTERWRKGSMRDGKKEGRNGGKEGGMET